jgi:N-acetyl-alpha-D-muramate 1-phosphate uridylyltransferase
VSGLGSRAMVLAAGLGMRMRPLTLTRPKPLLAVNGKALIDYALEKLCGAGVDRAVVNVHYLPEQIEAWARRHSAPRIMISDERAELLDTGGGVGKALPLLGPEPFYVLNSDTFWADGPTPALARLGAAWRDAAMDCLLLLCPLAQTIGFDGMGDFHLAADGRLTRRQGDETGALAYAGAFLVHPRLFRGAPAGKFSMNVLWDRAIATGRLHGIAHDGPWFHIGTPDAIPRAEAVLRG